MSPITLRAKAVIQNLCRQKLQWDDKISKVDENEWKTWLNSLLHLENAAVKRCFKPHDFGSIQIKYKAHNYICLLMDPNLITEHVHT